MIFYIILGLILCLVYKIAYPMVKCVLIKKKYGDSVETLIYPLIGNFYYQMKSVKQTRDSFTYQRELIKKNPNLKFFLSNFAGNNVLWSITCPQIAKEFLQKSELFKFQSLPMIDEFAAQGMIFSNGSQWKRQRQSLNHVFHFDELKKRVEPMKEVISEAIPKLIEKSKNGETLAIIQEMQDITGEVIVRSFFGKKLVDQNVEGSSFQRAIATLFGDAIGCVRELSYAIKSVLFNSYFAQNFFLSEHQKKSYKKLEYLRNITMKCIEDAIQDYKPSNENKLFIDILIAEYLKDQKNQDQKKDKNHVEMTKEEIMQQFMGFYFAGMETTANLAAKLIVFLGVYPDVYTKLQKEIDQTFQNPSEITHEKLKNMKFLNAYVKETLRFYPSVTGVVTRMSDKDIQLGDFIIPKGQRIGLDIAGIHRNSKNFPNADKFDVDRWLDETKIQQNSTLAFIPFSAGPRNCIGQHMAIIEAQIIVVYLLKHFEVLPIDKKSIILMNTVTYTFKNDKIVKLKVKQ